MLIRTIRVVIFKRDLESLKFIKITVKSKKNVRFLSELSEDAIIRLKNLLDKLG